MDLVSAYNNPEVHSLIFSEPASYEEYKRRLALYNARNNPIYWEYLGYVKEGKHQCPGCGGSITVKELVENGACGNCRAEELGLLVGVYEDESL